MREREIFYQLRIRNTFTTYKLKIIYFLDLLYIFPGVARVIKLDKILYYRTSLYAEKTIFHFLSNCMGYDCGDSFPSDFEPNEIPFGSRSKGKLSPRSYPIQFERNWKLVLSVQTGKPPPTDLQLSESLASLGIMGAQLRPPLKSPVHHSTIILRGLIM